MVMAFGKNENGFIILLAKCLKILLLLVLPNQTYLVQFIVYIVLKNLRIILLKGYNSGLRLAIVNKWFVLFTNELEN